MAVRPLHINDGTGIAERRLRPIYDWLDNGNYKKALQEAEKVLKKAPSLQAARALKALALFRLGRGSEGQVVLDALADEKPSDDSTLQAMTISYRESQQLHKVCTLYEAAVKAEPLSEELHSHLFMSYVRIGDYRAQQRAAMALYKFAPKNPYYFWAVMSIVLQAKATSDAKQKSILLAVAQRMIDNFITEGKMEAEQEARLYIMILELQDKWEDIVKFLDSPLYSQIVPGSTNQACIPYLKRLGQWKRLNLICKELLYDNQDRWDFYMPYFDSVFELMKLPDNDSSVDDSPEKCHEFLCQIVESISGKSMRGPYLARLELWRRLSIDGDPTALLGSGVALCRQYLRVFGHKACAVPDLRQYLGMIPQAEREENSRDFLTCLGFDEDSEPDSSDDIQRHISCLSLYRLTAPPLPPEQSLNLATKLRAHYLRCAKNGLLKATLTEFGAADTYAILAAHHYFYAGVEEKNSCHIIEALSLLELALHNSPSNFHAKLLLVKLYHLLGNALAADTIYQKLEIKHIQLVSLGWIHITLLAPACAFTKALQLLADTRAFHSHHAKDSVEQVTAAYKYGTFEKLCELMSWGGGVAACGAAAGAARTRATLALLAGPPQPLHQPTPLHTHPTDNRDLRVIVNYEPPQYQDVDLKRRTFEQDVAYLRLKDGLVTSLALCIESSDQRPLEERMVQYKELKSCVDAFNTAMEKCKQLYDVKEKITISGPFPSRIIAFVTSPVPYRELYTTALNMVGEYCVNHNGPAHEYCIKLTSLMTDASNVANELTLKGDPIWCIRDMLEHLSNYLEFIGIMTYLLGVCHEYITPSTANANTKKSKKKANQSPEEIRTLESLSKLNETLQNCILTLEITLEQIPTYDNNLAYSSLEEELSKLDLSNFKCPVRSKLRNGREEMVNDVKNVLKKKVKYLKSLI